MAVAYTKMALAVMVCMAVVVSPWADAAVTCGAVSRSVIGCLPYLKGAPKPTASCCGGVKSLVAQAKSTADQKTACGCLKQAAGSIKGINFKNAASLPGKCGVSIPYALSPTTDCSKIH